MEATGRQFENAREAWPLYDTLQIHQDMTDPKGIPSYFALSQLEEIPFFTVRNRSEVGLAYTNKESKDATPFVYYLHSIGIECRSQGNFTELKETPTAEDIAAMNSARVFEQIIPYHIGAILKVREDEKLATTVEFAPAGMGLYSYTAGAVPALVHASTIGWASLGNRFQFPDPIAIPRNTVLAVTLKLSAYARYLLSHMVGPGAVIPLVDDPTSEAPAELIVKANSLIRVTLNGFREVQQRGELHY